MHLLPIFFLFVRVLSTGFAKQVLRLLGPYATVRCRQTPQEPCVAMRSHAMPLSIAAAFQIAG